MYKLKLINKPKLFKLKCNFSFPSIVLASLQEKEIIPTKQNQEIVADENYDGLSKVIVNKIPDKYIIPTGKINITSNGTYDVNNYEIANVNISGIEINDCSYLFYSNARLNVLNELLKICKNVTSVSNMFKYCTSLTELNLSNFFDTSKVTSMAEMFANCSYLTELDLSNFNTSKVKNLTTMFGYCSRLKKINLNDFNASNVDSLYSMFFNCNSLEELNFMNNLGKGYTIKALNWSEYRVNLSYSPKLTYNSLMDVINKLYDLNLTYNVASGETLYTQQLIIGSTNIAKLTSEEIEIATNKGWGVS